MRGTAAICALLDAIFSQFLRVDPSAVSCLDVRIGDAHGGQRGGLQGFHALGVAGLDVVVARACSTP